MSSWCWEQAGRPWKAGQVAAAMREAAVKFMRPKLENGFWHEPKTRKDDTA